MVMKNSDWGEVRAGLEYRDVMRGQSVQLDAAFQYLENMRSLTPDAALVGTQLRESYHVSFSLPLIEITVLGVEDYEGKFADGYNDDEDGVLQWR